MEPIPTLTNREHCPNCGSTFTGPYCKECGERKLKAKDFTFSAFLKDLISETLTFDGKIIRSLRRALFNPGRYLRDYLGGKRKPYLRPVQVFLIANALYFFFPLFNTFVTPLDIQLNAFPYSEFATAQTEALISELDTTLSSFEVRFNQATTILSKSLLILFSCLIGVNIWVLNRWKNINGQIFSSINLALLYSGFLLMGLLILIPSLILGLSLMIPDSIVLLDDHINSTIMLFLSGTYLFWGLHAVNEEHYMLSLLKSTLVTLSIMPTLFLYRFILFEATLFYIKYFG